MKTIFFDYHNSCCVIPKSVINSVKNIIENVHASIDAKCAPLFRKEIIEKLYDSGWDKNTALSFDSKISITAYKEGIGLCCQTGNVSRIYADLLKLQTLWVANSIIAGIIVVPVSTNAKKLGDNMATYERLKRELSIFERVISMPILIIGIDGLEE